MQGFGLTGPVEYSGQSLIGVFGGTPCLRLIPTEKSGWWWRVNGVDIPLTIDLLQANMRRLCLVYGDAALETFEHIGAFRIMGYDGIVVECSHRWPPHDGCGKALHDAIAKQTKPRGVLRRLTVSEPLHVGTDDRFVEFIPSPTNCLEIRVFIKYENFSEPWTLAKTFRGGLDEEICAAKTISVWPWCVYWAAKHAPKWLWSHYDETYWANVHTAPEILHFIASHRIFDVFGALSLVCPPGATLVGTINTWCAGHSADAALLREIKRVGLVSVP